MSNNNSPSTLSHLRQYRFQRTPTPGSSGTVTIRAASSNSQTIIRMPAPANEGNRVPVVYKRIRIQSSDSDDNSPMKKPATSFQLQKLPVPNSGQRPVTVVSNSNTSSSSKVSNVSSSSKVSNVSSSSKVSNVSSSNQNPSSELTTAIKEKRFRNMLAMFPEISPMLVKNVMARHNWSEERSRDELLKHDPEFTGSTASIIAKPAPRYFGCQPGNSTNGTHSKAPTTGLLPTTGATIIVRKPLAAKGGRARRGSSGSEDDDYGVRKGKDDRVYDSDDSDSEITNDLVGDKRKVFDFLNNSNMYELSMLSGCSQKKAEAIIALRPFKTWMDMIEKFTTNKGLSAELLNSTQELLATRNNIQKLMKKCVGLAQQLEAAVAAGTSRLGQPMLLDPTLKLATYQLVGLNWLAVLHKQGVSGILADEMGLGKTVQVIAFLAHLKETGQARGTHLIVVPASTLDNWSSELSRWCSALRVSKYYGNPEERRQLRIEYARHLDRYDIVLTTYTMVHSCPEERKMFRVTPMHYVIYDEAHMLKNMSTQRYDNLLKIKSKHRLLLTGTPLQNNLIELMSLLCFVMPHMFSGKTEDLKSLFQKNAKYKGTKKGESTEDDVPPFEQSQITQAKRIMKPFVLRRLKRDVLQDLPTKTNKTELVPMSEKQQRMYKELCAGFAAKDGTIHATTEQSGISMMMDMRKLANHPLLMRYYYQHDMLRQMASRLARDPGYKEKNEQYAFEDLLCLSDFQIHQLTLQHQCISSFSVPEQLILDSGKFQFLDELLPKLKADGHRVLVFSQFTMMLDILEPYLQIRRHRYLRLDGSTAVVDRQDLIDQYNSEDIFVFLLSTKAGGLGINLTAADTVVIHDIDFNPYNDKQAEDRCHRLGQTREVTIHRLLSAGSIEEGIYQVAQEKLNLEKHVTGTDEKDPNEQKNVVRLLSVALGMTSK